jgi:hypothetical protein
MEAWELGEDRTEDRYSDVIYEKSKERSTCLKIFFPKRLPGRMAIGDSGCRMMNPPVCRLIERSQGGVHGLLATGCSWNVRCHTSRVDPTCET